MKKDKRPLIIDDDMKGMIDMSEHESLSTTVGVYKPPLATTSGGPITRRGVLTDWFTTSGQATRPGRVVIGLIAKSIGKGQRTTAAWRKRTDDKLRDGTYDLSDLEYTHGRNVT